MDFETLQKHLGAKCKEIVQANLSRWRRIGAQVESVVTGAGPVLMLLVYRDGWSERKVLSVTKSEGRFVADVSWEESGEILAESTVLQTLDDLNPLLDVLVAEIPSTATH